MSKLGCRCRLGLATRGGTGLTVADVQYALDHGVDFLNWPGRSDALSRTSVGLGPRRQHVHVCVQFEARSAAEAATELDGILRELNTDYVDILTFYYVEAAQEWQEILGPGGAYEYCLRAREQGKVRWLGVTSH